MEVPVIVNSTHSLLATNSHLAVPYMSILSLASVAGTFGNILIFISMLCLGTRKDGTPVAVNGYIFIGNLSLSDLIVTAIINPSAVVGAAYGEGMFLGRTWLCRALATLCIISCVTSLLTIGCIAFCRYLYICHYHYFRKVFSSKQCFTMCILTWIIGVLLDLPNYFQWGNHAFDKKTQKCLFDRNHNHSYIVFFVLIGMIFPFIVIIIFYTRIFYSIGIAKKHLISATHGNLNGAIKKTLYQSRIMFAIFLVFCICWLPYIVVLLVDSSDSVRLEGHLIVSLIAHLHASLNFIIYGLCHKKIRQTYKGVILRLCRMRVSMPHSELEVQDVSHGAFVGLIRNKGFNMKSSPVHSNEHPRANGYICGVKKHIERHVNSEGLLLQNYNTKRENMFFDGTDENNMSESKL